MRTLHMISLVLILAGCENKFSQESIPTPPALDEGYLSNSLKALEISLQRNPDNSELYFQQASILRELGREGSMPAIEKALALNPDRADYHLVKAQVHRSANQNFQAFKSAQTAERLGANNPELFQLLAELQLKQGNHLEALSYINQFIKLRSADANILLVKSQALLGLQDTVNAEYFLRKSLDSDADEVENYMLALRIFMARGEYDTASVMLRKALSLEPNNPELILYVGEWLHSDGQLDSAESVWRRLETNEDYQIEAWRLLSQTKFKRQQYDSASLYSNKVLAREDGDLEASLTLVRVADKQGNLGLARQEYNKILARDSTLQIAQTELDNLNRKVAYLQRIRQELEQQKSQISTIVPKKLDEQP